MSEPLFSMLVWHDATIKPPTPCEVLVLYKHRSGESWICYGVTNDEHWNEIVRYNDNRAWLWSALVAPTATSPPHPPAPPIPASGDQPWTTQMYHAVETRLMAVEERVSELERDKILKI